MKYDKFLRVRTADAESEEYCPLSRALSNNRQQVIRNALLSVLECRKELVPGNIRKADVRYAVIHQQGNRLETYSSFYRKVSVSVPHHMR